MEPRKYSTGTKGRLKMHADQCREMIRQNAGNFHLGEEFIESIDPGKEDRVWQRFQSPEDVLPELRAWLSGGEIPVEPPKSPFVPASRLKVPDPKLARLLEETREWVEKNGESLSALTPLEAVAKTLDRLAGRS